MDYRLKLVWLGHFGFTVVCALTLRLTVGVRGKNCRQEAFFPLPLPQPQRHNREGLGKEGGFGPEMSKGGTTDQLTNDLRVDSVLIKLTYFFPTWEGLESSTFKKVHSPFIPVRKHT